MTGVTLLIVDGDKKDQSSLKRILESEVGKIISLTDPKRINEILRSNEVDIVILEMNFKAGQFRQ